MREFLTGLGLMGSGFALFVSFGVAVGLALTVLVGDALAKKLGI